MNRSQQEKKAVLILKLLNVITGALNAMLSIVLVYITLFLISATKAHNHSWLGPFILIFLFILMMCVSKLCFDFVFIYGVVKERLMIVKLYCYLSVVLFILMTTFMIIVGPGFINTYIWIIFYSLNISTILLSHFYEQICDRDDDTTHKV